MTQELTKERFKHLGTQGADHQKRIVQLGLVVIGVLLPVLIFWLVAFPITQQPLAPRSYPNFRIEFFNTQTGVIIGPRVLHTRDSGKTWSIIDYANPADAIKPTDNPRYARNLIDFVDPEWAWRASRKESDSIEYSVNGGVSWSEPIRTRVKARGPLVFVSRDVGWVLGDVPVATRDGGKTWREESALQNLRFEYPFFLDSNRGWLGNYWGVIAVTADGGQHWETYNTELKQMRALFFLDSHQGWIVGDNGLVASTQNGGKDWTRTKVPVPSDGNRKRELLDVFFLSQDLGWIVGEQGVVLLTKDGGKSWIRVSTPTDAPLCSVRFIDALHGWAVGGHPPPVIPISPPSNVVLETSDGGQTWNERTF